MGTICILFGVIALLAFSGAGILAANAFLSNPMYASLFEIDASMAYIVIVGVCLFVGLLVFMSLLTSGLIYNRQKKQFAQMKRMLRKHED